MTPLMTATGLVQRYAGRGAAGTVTAVDGISLTLDRAEVLGIVGESGSGKSTLARMLTGMEQPKAGSVQLHGRPLDRHAGRRVQMIFQDPLGALDPRMRIAEQVAEPLAIHGVGDRASRRARAAELLGMVGIDAHEAQRFPHELSGGQRQRVVIARALSLSPELLVCDEPVSALDVSIQARIVNLLRDLQRDQGMAMVFISHDLRVVRHISDRIAVIYLGRIVESGPAAAILAAPRHPYTAALVASSPRPRLVQPDRPAAPILAGEPPDPAQRPSGCAFHPRCPRADAVCRTTAPQTQGAIRMLACHHPLDDAGPCHGHLPPAAAASKEARR